MTTIELLDVKLYAYHGVYDEEATTGNDYIVNLAVSFNEVPNQFNSLSGTVNYESLFEIIRQRMKIKTTLIEKLCEGIIGHIRHQYPFLTEIKLSIHKLQAPIENLNGKVGVTMHKRYEV